MDQETAFRLAVRMETKCLRSTKPQAKTDFWYPKVVDTSITYHDLVKLLCAQYPWSEGRDAVDIKYWDSAKQAFVPLTCDMHLGLLFGPGVQFGKIHIEVIQLTFKGYGKSSNSSNTKCLGTPRRKIPCNLLALRAKPE